MFCHYSVPNAQLSWRLEYESRVHCVVRVSTQVLSRNHLARQVPASVNTAPIRTHIHVLGTPSSQTVRVRRDCAVSWQWNRAGDPGTAARVWKRNCGSGVTGRSVDAASPASRNINHPHICLPSAGALSRCLCLCVLLLSSSPRPPTPVLAMSLSSVPVLPAPAPEDPALAPQAPPAEHPEPEPAPASDTRHVSAVRPPTTSSPSSHS